MGYMRHHAIVVTSWKRDLVKEAAKVALEFGLIPMLQQSESINGYSTLCVAPDGSKEGWSDSDTCDAARDAFIGWLDGHRYEDGSSPVDFVEIEFGGDGNKAVILADSRGL